MVGGSYVTVESYGYSSSPTTLLRFILSYRY
jgi:hypothetical protein